MLIQNAVLNLDKKGNILFVLGVCTDNVITLARVPKHVAGKKFATDIIENGEIFAGVDPAILDIPQEQKNGDAVPNRRYKQNEGPIHMR